MGNETLPSGITVSGMPTDIKKASPITPEEIKAFKVQMYTDFIQAKQQGKVALAYKFDEWVRDSLNTLRTLRKYDIDSEYRIGKIGKLEHEALEEMRQRLMSAILKMDTSDLDQYGIKNIDPNVAQMMRPKALSELDNRLLIPTQRKNVIKFKREK